MSNKEYMVRRYERIIVSNFKSQWLSLVSLKKKNKRFMVILNANQKSFQKNNLIFELIWKDFILQKLIRNVQKAHHLIYSLKCILSYRNHIKVQKVCLVRLDIPVYLKL